MQRVRESRVAVPAARLLAAAAVLAALVAAALPLVTGGGWLRELFATPEPVVAPSFAVVGALLVGLPAARRFGWLMVAVGCSAAAYVLSTSWAYWVGAEGLAGWLRSWTWVPALLLVTTVLPQVVPYGRPLAGRWRLLAAAAVAVTAGTTALLALPLGVDDPFSRPAFLVVLAVLLAGSAASLVVRVRRADPSQRRQLAWVAYGVGAAVVATFFAPWWLVAPAVVLVPVSLAVAAYRYRLYDIDLLVNKTLVAAALLALAALVYAAVAGWAGAVVGAGSGPARFLATFAVALVFHPAYVRVQRLVDRLLHGDRSDPYRILGRVDDALRGAASPRAALGAGLEAVVDGLRLSGARVEVTLPDGTVVQERLGAPVERGERAPLVLHGEKVGMLEAGPRPGSSRLDRTDRHALAALAGRFASAAYAARLAGDLEASRERLVTAQEEERRRLRRDLHDGLGPQLAAVVMTLDTAASALRRHDEERAATLVSAASAQAAGAVIDVRRLVHGLRPPALDDLGLLGALRAGAAPLAADGLTITVEGSGELAGLPAAVEVGVLRIAQEALLNAVRHAGATRIEVWVGAGEEEVEVEVRDDGGGIGSDRTPGVGLSSMRERAAELGGTCEVGNRRGAGTRVRAVLPRRPPA